MGSKYLRIYASTFENNITGKEPLQDFNEGVLRLVTCPNVSANLRCRGDLAGTSAGHTYISGDFASVGEHLAKEGKGASFDWVLTSESIYNPKSAEQLLRACDLCLKPDGRVLVAAKNHYFGVGGGLAAFKKRLEQGGVFVAETVWTSDDGSGNMREVLELRRI